MFIPHNTFVSTGDKKSMYTLRKWGLLIKDDGKEEMVSLPIQNLATDKERALIKGRILSQKYKVPFIEEIDFDLNEITRREQEALPEEDVSESPVSGSEQDFIEYCPDGLEGQELAIHEILAGNSVFIFGAGGVGKSHVIRQIVDESTLLCSFSGVAALNIGGTTCHKAFGLSTTVVTASDYKLESKTANLLRSVKRIVIDEISQLRKDYFELIEWKLRKARGNDQPFGGVQMVMVGDFYQIPPVLVGNEKMPYMQAGWDSRWAFTSSKWDFKTIELTHVWRQEDKRQANILHAIRKNTEKCAKALYVIQKESTPYDEAAQMLHLCTTNASVQRINSYWYEKLSSKEKTFTASKEGKFSPGELPVEEVVRVKEGAKVVMCANHPEGLYQNGTRGTVTRIIGDTVVVKGEHGEFIVEPYKWSKFVYEAGSDGKLDKREKGFFKQIPIKLGWAITIHKAQGMTLDKIAIDVGRGCFEHGQLYVALSRVRDLTNLSFVTPIRHSDVIIDKEVQEFLSPDKHVDISPT